MALSNLLKVINPNTTVQINPANVVPQQVSRTRQTRTHTHPNGKGEWLHTTPITQPMPTGMENTLFCPELEGGRFLKKVELWFGNPSTGKTTLARLLGERLKRDGIIDDVLVINCHEEMTVMSTLKTTKTNESGAWIFTFNKLFNALTDSLKKRYLAILDEANTMNMSVWKAFQPLLDDTEGNFEFEDKTYEKNPNVNFIITLNHNDIGITPIPDAVKSRVFPVEFEDLDVWEVSKRSGVPVKIIELMGRIRNMFSHLGDLPNFHTDVRQLKNIVGLTRRQFEKYITSELSFHHIEWKEAVAISAEFENMLDEFAKVKW